MSDYTKLGGIYIGNDRSLVLTVKVNGVAVDISDDTLILTIKDSMTSGAVLEELINSPGDHDSDTGQTTFVLTSEFTATLLPKIHYLDVTWERVNPEMVRTLFVATLPVLRPVRMP